MREEFRRAWPKLAVLMARTAAAVAPGSLVLGRFRPIRPLGSGSSGSVWLAEDDESGREVALKIVPREGNAGERAEREASAAAKLRHQRCLRAYALARDPGHVYIVYEYVPGRTLREAMRSDGLDDTSVLETAAQILDGLANAHAHGIVHRDVKPANVLLADGTDVRVKLFDFGLAVMHEHEALTAVGDIPGTLAYISPDRLQTSGPSACCSGKPSPAATRSGGARCSTLRAVSKREHRPSRPSVRTSIRRSSSASTARSHAIRAVGRRRSC